MKYDNYLTLIENNKYEEIYKDLKDKSLSLIKDIFTILNISYEEDYYILEYSLKTKSLIFFDNLYPIINTLSLYYESNIDIEDDLINGIKTIINNYNKTILLLKDYNTYKKELSKLSIEDSINDRIDNYRILFKELLRYKNKTYKSIYSFKELINIIDNYYSYYHNILLIIKDISNNNNIYIDEDVIITITNEERLLLLDKYYNEIKTNYKKYANLYTDYDLDDGLTFEDLISNEDYKYNELYKEMLDYKNIFYDEDTNLEELIFINYPKFIKKINYAHSAFLHRKPNPVILDTMEEIYNEIKTNYKKEELL